MLKKNSVGLISFICFAQVALAEPLSSEEREAAENTLRLLQEVPHLIGQVTAFFNMYPTNESINYVSKRLDPDLGRNADLILFCKTLPNLRGYAEKIKEGAGILAPDFQRLLVQEDLPGKSPKQKFMVLQGRFQLIQAHMQEFYKQQYIFLMNSSFYKSLYDVQLLMELNKKITADEPDEPQDSLEAEFANLKS